MWTPPQQLDLRRLPPPSLPALVGGVPVFFRGSPPVFGLVCCLCFGKVRGILVIFPVRSILLALVFLISGTVLEFSHWASLFWHFRGFRSVFCCEVLPLLRHGGGHQPRLVHQPGLRAVVWRRGRPARLPSSSEQGPQARWAVPLARLGRHGIVSRGNLKYPKPETSNLKKRPMPTSPPQNIFKHGVSCPGDARGGGGCLRQGGGPTRSRGCRPCTRAARRRAPRRRLVNVVS